jgi:hypothetical protein
MKRSLLLIALIFLPMKTVQANESFFDKKRKTVNCAEPLPIFTLAEKSNPSNSEVKKLCACIWTSFSDGGWEQKISEKIRAGVNPGPDVNEFIPRFGEALKKCGGQKL